MFSQLEQACKTYSTDSSNGLIDFDTNWQCIFVTALTFLLDQAIRRNGLASLAIPTLFLVSSDILNTVDSRYLDFGYLV